MDMLKKYLEKLKKIKLKPGKDKYPGDPTNPVPVPKPIVPPREKK